MIPWKTEVIAQQSPTAKPAFSANQLSSKIPTGVNDINEIAIPIMMAIMKKSQILVKCGIIIKLTATAKLATTYNKRLFTLAKILGTFGVITAIVKTKTV